MARFALLLCLSALSLSALAQDGDGANPLLSDDVRLEELRARFEGGIPTVSAVDELRDEAFGRFEAGECAAAVPALEELAERSNLLANALTQTLEPYYDTYESDRDRASYGPGGLGSLASAENEANARKADRDAAYVALGECHEELGNPGEALAYYSQALDLLLAVREHTDLWLRAREGVYRIVEYDLETP